MGGRINGWRVWRRREERNDHKVGKGRDNQEGGGRDDEEAREGGGMMKRRGRGEG